MESDTKKIVKGAATGALVATIGFFCAAPFCRAANGTTVKSKPDVVIYEGTYPGWPWIAAGADGTLYCVFRDGTEHGFSAAGRALLTKSSDLGKTWTAVRIPESPEFTGDEWYLVETAPGHLLAIMRNANHSKPAALCCSESRDGGLTWSMPKATNLTTGLFAPGQIFLQGVNRTPTVIYPDRRMISVSAVKSDDPARLKWKVDSLLPCYLYNADQSPIPDGSYAVSAPTGPNQRLVVDYEIRPKTKRITGYFIDFPADW